ncbi:membrane protein, partial [Xanthomonas vesicatoria]
RSNPQLLYNAFFAAVPSTLLVLVPLFALLLRVFYLRSGRVYLEHLVVALYSHAFLCLNLLAMLLLSLLGESVVQRAPPIAWSIGVLQFGLAVWMPLYLLGMQRHVYGQSWSVTVLKYLGLGSLYSVVVTFAAAFLMVASLTRL